MSLDKSELEYRENVCLLIFNSSKQLFLGERAGQKGVWQFPQGGAEKEFSLQDNALKEASEELGCSIDKFKIFAKLEHTHKYDFNVPPAYAVGKYRGQQQTFWLLSFLGEDSDIKLENSDKEFQGWLWVGVNKVRELAEEKRLPGYEPALIEFEKLVIKSA
jgi:putative (di)nucleoside polyphosphate hydrolase